ncbi:MAG: hypothetical protein ABIP28_00655 [Mucilaginibacter sp.]
MKFYIIPVIIVCLIACRPKEKAGVSTEKQVVVHKRYTTLIKTTYKGKYGRDTIYKWYPNDSLVYPVNITTAGSFHSNEVIKKASSLKWTGIFKNDTGYYLAPATVKTQHFEDIGDEAGQKTGIDIIVDNAESCALLISGMNGLSMRKIDAMPGKMAPMPGEKQGFTYKGTQYLLYAFGNKQPWDIKAKEYTITNYRLYISATINGRKIEQLLLGAPNISYLREIILVGDIDGDNIPDLVMDTATDENVTSITLYLSKPAAKGKLYKLVGQHTTVGC